MLLSDMNPFDAIVWRGRARLPDISLMFAPQPITAQMRKLDRAKQDLLTIRDAFNRARRVGCLNSNDYAILAERQQHLYDAMDRVAALQAAVAAEAS